MKKQQANRRAFIKQGIAAAASVSPLMAMLGSLGSVEAAETEGEYKAIVCVMLEGGSDSFNMVVPIDGNYQAYYDARKDIALPKDSLLPINAEFGMRDNMKKMQLLFEQNKLAIVANVGTLAEPVTLNNLSSVQLPAQLFAHNTQQALWMYGDAKNTQAKGWAARAGDEFYKTTPNPYFNVTVAGNNIMQMGGIAEAISFDDASISPDVMSYYGFGPKSGSGELGAIYQSIYDELKGNNHKILSTFAQRRVMKMDQQETLSENDLFFGAKNFSGFSKGEHEAGKSLGEQLELVAKILSIKDRFPEGRKRQVFFVKHSGWDTHDKDNSHQVEYLSDMLGAFSNALDNIGIADLVTTCTLSDFGRSLTSNGNGTDHGWGGYAYVMGGMVNGGEIYGTMPTLAIDSPDSWSGRIIPTTSTEQYLSPILRWFGTTEEAELDSIFPNRGSFVDKGLWFMG
jgi:uncharacterized protein (DUF1501 family)